MNTISRLLLLLSLALAGCSSAAQSAAPSAAPASASVEASASPTPEPDVSQEPRTLTFDLEPMGVEREAHGTVVVDVHETGYIMTITVEGLAPNAQYPINVHGGRCPRPTDVGNAWVTQQTPADEDGVLVYEDEVEGLWEVPEDGRTLTIHGRLPMDARTHIACADLTE